MRSLHRLHVSCLAAVSLIAVRPGDVTEEQVRAAGEQALAAVGEALSLELGDSVRVRISTSEEIAQILDQELAHQFAVQFDDADVAQAQCRAFSRVMSEAVLAKYAHGDDTIHVAPENIHRFARLLDAPQMESEACLRALLVHEAAHAVADRLYHWPEAIEKLDSTDAILAYNAVLEGHAQFLARKICREQGWSEGFEIFTRSIGATPDIEDEAVRQIMRVMSVTFSFAYHDGERFIASLHEAGGDAAIARVFAQPPDSPTLIFHPEWYLDPATRPKIAFDFDEALDGFVRDFGESRWTAQRMTLTPPQLDAAFGLLPKDDVARILSGIRHNKMAILHWKEAPGERLVAAALFELTSHAEAAFFLASEERLMRVKDEKMNKGSIRITDSRYTPQDFESFHGVHAWKKVETPFEVLEVTSVVLVRGRLAIELTFSNEERSMEEAVALARRALETAEASEDTGDGR